MVTRPPKGKDAPAKVVWRISANAPLGEYVQKQPDGSPPAPSAAKPVTVAKKADVTADEMERGWYHSSRDLVHGMDVIEEPLPVPPPPRDLADKLFRKKP